MMSPTPLPRLELRLSNPVTNGSVPGPFKNDAEPAVLALDSGCSDFRDIWTINGTQSALYEAPDRDSSNLGVW